MPVSFSMLQTSAHASVVSPVRISSFPDKVEIVTASQ